jgi:hypothetical protein
MVARSKAAAIAVVPVISSLFPGSGSDIADAARSIGVTIHQVAIDSHVNAGYRSIVNSAHSETSKQRAETIRSGQLARPHPADRP